MDGMSKTAQTHSESNQSETILPVHSIIPLFDQNVGSGFVRVQNYETMTGHLNR